MWSRTAAVNGGRWKRRVTRVLEESRVTERARVASLQQASWGGPAGGSLYPLHDCGLWPSLLDFFYFKSFFLKITHLFFFLTLLPACQVQQNYPTTPHALMR